LLVVVVVLGRKEREKYNKKHLEGV